MSETALARAYIEFGARGMDKVHGAIKDVKQKLKELPSAGATEIGSALKGVMSGSGGVGGMVQSITSAFSAASPAIAALMTNPFTVAIGAAIVAATPMVLAAAERERKMVNMTNATGSAGKSRAIMGGLASTFSGTDIGEEQYARVSRDMAAAGIPAEKLVGHMRTIGNIAATTGDSFEGMAEAYERVEITGKVSARTIMAMKPVAEELAKMYHTNTEEITRWAESGRIGAVHVTAAMERLGGETGKWGKAMENQKGTVSGLWQQITATMKGMVGDWGAPLLEVIRPILAWAKDFLGATREMGKFLTNLILPAYKMIGYAISAITAPFRAVYEIMKGVLGPINDVLSTYSDLIGEILDLFRELLPSGTSFKDIITFLLTPLRMACGFIKSILEYMIGIVRATKEWINTLGKIGTLGIWNGPFGKGNETPPLGAGTGGKEFSFHGLAQYAEAMQQKVGDDVAQQQLDATKDGVEAQKKVAEAADGGAIRVKVINQENVVYTLK